MIIVVLRVFSECTDEYKHSLKEMVCFGPLLLMQVSIVLNLEYPVSLTGLSLSECRTVFTDTAVRRFVKPVALL